MGQEQEALNKLMAIEQKRLLADQAKLVDAVSQALAPHLKSFTDSVELLRAELERDKPESTFKVDGDMPVSGSVSVPEMTALSDSILKLAGEVVSHVPEEISLADGQVVTLDPVALEAVFRQVFRPLLQLKSLELRNNKNASPREYIPVRLTDGDAFYKAEAHFVGGGSTTGGSPLAKYFYSAKSETATYKYFFFEDADENWYIARKVLATGVFDYAVGTGGYQSVYDDATSDPIGPMTFGNIGSII